METLLVVIIVILALNLLVNVSMWSRKNALYNRFTFWICNHLRWNSWRVKRRD